MKLTQFFRFDSQIQDPVGRTARLQPTPANLDAAVNGLRKFVESGKGTDPEMLALADLVCRMGESFAQLCIRLHHTLADGHPNHAERAAIVDLMNDVLTIGQNVSLAVPDRAEARTAMEPYPDACSFGPLERAAS